VVEAMVQTKVLTELATRYGKPIILKTWTLIKPLVKEQVKAEIIKVSVELTNWTFNKINGIFSNRNEILEETAQFNIEKCKQNASETDDANEIIKWNAKAEVWEEVYKLITKEAKETMTDIDDLQTEAMGRSETLATDIDKRLEEEVTDKIMELPEGGSKSYKTACLIYGSCRWAWALGTVPQVTGFADAAKLLAECAGATNLGHP